MKFFFLFLLVFITLSLYEAPRDIFEEGAPEVNARTEEATSTPSIESSVTVLKDDPPKVQKKTENTTPSKPAAKKETPTIIVEFTAESTSTISTSSAPVAPEGTQTDFEKLLEQEVHTRINAMRQEHGLSPVLWNERLAEISRIHSNDMLENDYFSHEAPDGCDMLCRAEKAAYVWQTIGENIYMTDGYTLDASALSTMIVTGWMNSSGHRANILNGSFTEQGIGVAVKNKAVYTTELLAHPR